MHRREGNGKLLVMNAFIGFQRYSMDMLADRKRLKLPHRTISYRAQVIFSLKQASHLTSCYSAPLLGSNLPLPLSVPETISSVFCEAFGAGFVMRC